ncbi:MAG: type 1 glutamine amidotransferase [Pseudomonadota bacterium]
MRLLVLQHHPEEHPGIFRRFLEEDGVAWDAVELDAGEAIPSLEGYDVLWSFGGPMDVWQEEAHPWLAREKAVIREAVVERGLPFLGVCLGHQLLAEALGGRVGPAPAEVGVMAVAPTAEGRNDPVIAMEGEIAALQWHSAGVLELPPGGVALARSPLCPVQALRWGERAYGIQYHTEVTEATVPTWGCIPEYKAALEKTLGPDALAAFEAEVARELPAFNESARRLYRGFMALAKETTA